MAQTKTTQRTCPAAGHGTESAENSLRRSESSYHVLHTDLHMESKAIIVLKVGTSSLVGNNGYLNLSSLCRISEVVKNLMAQGHRVVIVSSGAVGAGAQKLRLKTRPKSMAKKQALAAIGQLHLMRYYDDVFNSLDMTCAQVLLTMDNLADRSQYLNARATFRELLAMGVVPIVNENDTVAVQQLRFGDNDTLSAQVAAMIGADWCFLLTDVDCLYTANPTTHPDAVPIHEVANIAALAVDTSDGGTEFSTGGMATKITAARIATAGGVHLAICNAKDPEAVLRIAGGATEGTVFLPLQRDCVRGRKRWVLSVPIAGTLYLDAGAEHAIHTGKSLFPVGVIKVEGTFQAGDNVSLCNAEGVEFARGLSNYSSENANLIKGLKSKAAAERLGWRGDNELVCRSNLVCLVFEDDSNDGNSTSTDSRSEDGSSEDH